jgi:MFS family permease
MLPAMSATAERTGKRPEKRAATRTLAACGGAHALHDGYTDLIYVLLPVWQAEFALSIGAAGLLKSMFSGTMALLQTPASMLAERLGARTLLSLGTLITASAFLLMGAAGGAISLGLCLLLAGVGSSVQHPLGSALTARAFEGARLRSAIGVYNFAGDIGKVIFPVGVAALLTVVTWREAGMAVGLIGLAVAAVLPLLLRDVDAAPAAAPAAGGKAPSSRGFLMLTTVGAVDSATRMGTLTLMPFLLTQRGADVSTVGLALALTFIGGAAGKFATGFLAERAGVLRTIALTEIATALAIAALTPSSVLAMLILAPALGLALNGTSSALYGSVPDLVAPERRARAFGLYYTFTVGAGAAAPLLYGSLGDAIGVAPALLVAAVLVLLTLPLTATLRRTL